MELRAGPSDIQPSSHQFVHVRVLGVEPKGRSLDCGDSDLYGESVDHGTCLI